MKSFRRILRAVVLSLLLAAVVLPASLYLVLATPWAQEFARHTASSALSERMGVRVDIDRVRYRPFNTLAIYGVHVDDHSGRPALEAAAVSARFELWHFLRTGHIVVDYAVLDAPTLSLRRDAPGAPLNIQPLIDSLRPAQHDREPRPFDLKIGTAVVRGGRLTYDIASEPRRTAGIDPAHIAVDSLNLYADIRRITRDTYDLAIESLSLTERCGLRLTDLAVDVTARPERLELHSLSLRMPGTYIALGPAGLDIDGYGGIAAALKRSAVRIHTSSTARITPADLAWALPALAAEHIPLQLDLDADVSADRAELRQLSVADGDGFSLGLRGHADGLGCADSLRFAVDSLRLDAAASSLTRIIEPLCPAATAYVGRCGHLRLDASAAGSPADITARGMLATCGGTARFDGRLRRTAAGHIAEGQAGIDGIDVGRLLARADLGAVTLRAEGSADFGPRRPVSADARVDIEAATYAGYTYSDIGVEAALHERRLVATVDAADPSATLVITAEATDASGMADITVEADVTRLAPHALHLTPHRAGYALSGKAALHVTGHDADDACGALHATDLSFAPDSTAAGDALRLHSLEMTLARTGRRADLRLESDILEGSLHGSLSPTTLAATLRDMAAHTVPALIPHNPDLHRRMADGSGANDFAFSFSLGDTENLSRFLRLPVQVIYPVSIEGAVSSTRGRAHAIIDAPYLLQGDKIVEATVVQAAIDTADSRASVYATTRFPTKKGPMTAVVDVSGADNRFDTSIDWVIDRKIPLNGRFNFSTLLGRGTDGLVSADTRFNPGEITFGDDVWRIAPSSLIWADSRLEARDFALRSDTQSISIDGVAGPAMEDVARVELHDIELASIFETLEIDKALIGGRATGTFTARQALSPTPILTTDDLHVRGIGYNYCTLGDADVRAGFDTDRGAFTLDADIVSPEGMHSHIYGDILTAGALDLHFDARHIKVGFMKPFMSAFASDVEGYASGRARLFGTFKDIDLEGDILAEDLRLKIDFTNTWYSATDSIHIRPGLIDLRDITIRDVEGHTARLNGLLRHDYFHNPVFDFRITDARDFLSYNVTRAQSPDWYGTVYGNGSARVQGRPGVVEIDVQMATAPRSTFTFELSDRLEAEQYSFITFRDRTVVEVEDTLLAVPDDIPPAVKAFRDRMNARNTDSPSDYIMDIRVDITPQAQMVIVMDPVGGDRIRARGEGDLRLTYNAADNDLRMYGTYTLEQGNYNFTLQDIIIKDFTIDPGSSITFRGDPYSAQLDIEAAYSVNANLSDLDESFLQDKDLNRTNVPVQALMKVTGDMRQPDIAFDLRFPTLTSDTYRKVRSIISTDEMMNRQIIYLLALNRFYTPEYTTATRGNELFSVASSTISSQLSSMLGKLSDNWSIAPNLRSDRGDFSDVEVDLALSSRLLNNRLLFNGNFGYRDRSLNTNQFIGDFDIEYLLSPRGTWRLKAYNRYNDQNYYVRTAATTQGVGIVFRRDFDTLFHRRRKAAPADSVPADSTHISPTK